MIPRSAFLPAALLCLASSAAALTCRPVGSNSRSVDTLDRHAPIIRIITHLPKPPPPAGEVMTLELTVTLETISPSLLLADLKGEMESHRQAFIGQVIAVRPGGQPTHFGSVDTVGVLVEAVLKGDIDPGIHWFADRVHPWGYRYTGLAGRRLLWFRNGPGVEGPMEDLRQDGTVRPSSPCGGPISGHPILPDGRVTRGGSYEEFGVGVSLTTVLQTFNGVTSRLKADRTGAEGTGPAVIRGGGVPFILFTQGIPGPSGDAVSVDGRRHSLDALAP